MRISEAVESERKKKKREEEVLREKENLYQSRL
jgi:hypothetical protein